ncbi:NmrA family NAD(P)-binding protein [Pseudomonas sp. W5-36]|uniref:NmrA family NAD(P)-binding protein n=1 Tax=Pseudomonas sp. W5-36 TaxID=3097455 RepID=UPI00397D80DB
MDHTTASPIVVAGASGDLGQRLVLALVERGAHVIALVRPGTEQTRLTGLPSSGVTVTPVSLDDARGLRGAIAGAGCVVSTLNGLEEVIIKQQGRLLEAAAAAGVPRFIPSDYSLDYTHTRPGDNRNLDLRGASPPSSIQPTSPLPQSSTVGFWNCSKATRLSCFPAAECCISAMCNSYWTSLPRTT